MTAADGTALTTVQFDTSRLATVVSCPESLAGDTVKRFLVGITVHDGRGAGLPGYAYDYFWDDTSPGGQPGALKMVTSPQGGTASYGYDLAQLQACNRVADVAPPTSESTPRVFCGEDYCVVVWWDTSNAGQRDPPAGV